MKVKYLDKSSPKLILFLALVPVILILAALGAIYYNADIATYKVLFLTAIFLTIFVAFFLFLSVICIIYAYNKRDLGSTFNNITRMSLDFVKPFINVILLFSKKNKDFIRKIYIDVNNIIVSNSNKKYDAEKILLLLPHCLQNSDCKLKVAGSIKNCKRCGKCCIGSILNICDEFKTAVEIVTGGTAARNTVKLKKPSAIIAVACERDMASGIADIKTVPVFGLLNKRPNGPCSFTSTHVLKHGPFPYSGC